MSTPESFDAEKVVIKTEPEDSFDWENSGAAGAETPSKSGEANYDEFEKSADGAYDMGKWIKKIKRRDSSGEGANSSNSQFGNSEGGQSARKSHSHEIQDLKLTREELVAYSRNASKSNSAHSLSGGENSLGKTLATSLQLIATNNANSPISRSPIGGADLAYRIERMSCTSSSHVSGVTSPVMVLSPVIHTPLPRRYRTRSASKKFKSKSEKEKSSGEKRKKENLDEMKPLVNKDGSVTLYQCDECNKVFNKKQTLRQHFITHTDRFACPYCDSRCKSKGDLRTHIQTHTKEKPYHCEVCNTDYTRESILKKHMKTQLHMRACYERDNLLRINKMNKGYHDKEIDHFVPSKTKVRLEGLSCGQCSKVLLTRSDYKKHVKAHTLKHVCNICQKGCKSALLLKIHQKYHSRSNKLTCGICSRSFGNMYCLKEHLKSHKMSDTSKTSEENIIKAAISKHNKGIGKIKNQTKSLADPKRGKRGDGTTLKVQKYACDSCQKTFTSEKRLENHRHIHEGTYICGVCKKSFSSVSKLKLHLKFHTRVFKCEICYETFHAERDLTEHTQTQHVSDTDFTCKICYGRFDNASDLQHHMNDHAPTMLFSGGSLDESTIPVVNRSNKKPSHCGIENFRCSESDDTTDNDEKEIPKTSDKTEAKKSWDSDDDSILDSQEFYELINSALDGSDDNLNDTELSDSDEELFTGIRKVLEAEVLSSGDSDNEEAKEAGFLQKPLLYSHADIVKKHNSEFERYSEKDVENSMFKCKLCDLVFDESKYLKNHLKCHVCENCNKFFVDKEKLAEHKSRHVKQLLKQMKVEADRLHVPRRLWKGYLMACSDSENELDDDQFLNELEDILEGEPPKAPRSVNFLHTLSHDEILRVNRSIFEQFSCLDVTNNIFACTICKRKYARPTTLTRHFKTHVCQFCNKFFEDKSDLLEHKYRHRKKAALMKAEITGEGSKMPPSPVVSKPNRDLFKKYSYFDPDRNINRCTLCCKNFVRRTVLTRHMKTHICNHCDKFFEDKYDLAKHASYHKVGKHYMEDDGGDNDYAEFDEDEKQYSNSSSMAGNLEADDKSIALPPSFSSSLPHFNAPFHAQPSCSNRNETITFIQIPGTESGETAGTQVFSATGAGASSFQIISQPVDVYKETGQESFLVATSCPGNEPDKIITISQPQIVPSSSEGRERLFECGECGKRFFKNGHLKSHMTIHTGDRPYVCRLCGKSFGRGTTLRKHEKTHMKRCKICDTTFTYKYELDLHMEIHRTYAFYK